MINHNKKFRQALKEKTLELQENELRRGKSGRKYELRKNALLQSLSQIKNTLIDPFHRPPLFTSHNLENISLMKRKTTPRTGEAQITPDGKRRKPIAHK